MAVFGFIGCVLLGFCAGLFAFKTKDRWCPSCGGSTLSLRQALERQADRR